jgi:glycosyltransferase involved in cell wall biosynthesis
MTADTDAANLDAAGTCDVSVVIPVYNAMPYLRDLLDSLAAQDLPEDCYEIITVDDGSTDDGPSVLDEFARRHGNVTVAHQENSGWPGHPRNVGLDLASGRYVFFADADDELGAESLRRLVEFADEHQSDIVLPRQVGHGDRSPSWRFGDAAVDADLELALRKLTPHKLFRRSLLTGSGLRFPEEKVRLEDGMMLVRAYYAARRVSALGDYGYYVLRRRDDRGNITSRRLEPEGYTWSVGEVSRLIRENDPDRARADRIILDLYGRKLLKMYRPRKFADMPDPRRNRWMAEHQRYVSEFIPPELESQLNPLWRHRSERLRADDKEGLLTLGHIEQGGVTATLVRGRRTLRSVRLTISIELLPGADGRPDLVLQLQNRGSKARTDVPLVAQTGDPGAPPPRWDGLATVWVGSATIPRSMLRRRKKTVIQAHVQRTLDGRRTRSRVRVTDTSKLPGRSRTIEPFATKRGNLRFRVRPGRLRRWGSSLLRRGWLPRRRPAVKP